MNSGLNFSKQTEIMYTIYINIFSKHFILEEVGSFTAIFFTFSISNRFHIFKISFEKIVKMHSAGEESLG